MHVFIRNFGCSANTADGETLAGCLTQAGYQLTQSEAEADVIIYNSCAVKGPTENRIIDALKRIPKNKRVIVCGCLPMISLERLLREVRCDAVVGPGVGEQIVSVVGRVLNGEHFVEIDNALSKAPKLNLPRVAVNPVVSILPVNYGCLGSCAYCCVVHARGHLRSTPIADITARVEADLQAGVREFWVTSQDTACYGKDLQVNLADLINALNAVNGNFWVRIGMMTPNVVVPFLPPLIEAFGGEKIFKFVHLPVQSGDDEVLRGMRRFYTVSQFKEVVAAFRRAYPDITVSTDVICGFAGESSEAFQNTLQLMREVEPDVVNVSKFFVRPKTAALKMQDQFVPRGEIKNRSTETAKLAKQISLKRNQKWVGWTGTILIDENGKIPGTWIGRNYAYKPITIKNPNNLLGKTLRVQITKAYSTHLTATTLQP
ncbi:MAG: tRNA (N(6)-L-threonylcarbamoyladenosine(37)-C(2))-methylthiotransferase [Candidatus Bathyarchaeota archaeon]|nr:tRNA (N(6)-L-threonylcarbamoyladenosine(37)-C(2))-methylthiotransferase [Candidatus Bathyarchaeota archaeon]